MNTPITLKEFYKGDRDVVYADQLTPEIQAQVLRTLERANALLAVFYEANPGAYRRGCNSGWRPPAVNAATKNAAKLSKHMTGHAIDIADPDGTLDKWCMTPAGQQALTDIGLWLEHPSATPTWCHVQTVPPGSGRRVFYP